MDERARVFEDRKSPAVEKVDDDGLLGGAFPLEPLPAECRSHQLRCRARLWRPVAFELSAYAGTKGEITKFNSSPAARLRFCGKCGSTLTCESERGLLRRFPLSGRLTRPRRYNRLFPRRAFCLSCHLGEA